MDFQRFDNLDFFSESIGTVIALRDDGVLVRMEGDEDGTCLLPAALPKGSRVLVSFSPAGKKDPRRGLCELSSVLSYGEEETVENPAPQSERCAEKTAEEEAAAYGPGAFARSA